MDRSIRNTIRGNVNITVVEISGPMGCGKTTVASALAEKLTSQGLAVARNEREAIRLAAFGRVTLITEVEAR